MEEKFYTLIKNIVTSHKKYVGLESILDEIIEDAYKRSGSYINAIDDEYLLEEYLTKIVSTSIIKVTKKLNMNTRKPSDEAIALNNYIDSHKTMVTQETTNESFQGFNNQDATILLEKFIEEEEEEEEPDDTSVFEESSLIEESIENQKLINIDNEPSPDNTELDFLEDTTDNCVEENHFNDNEDLSTSAELSLADNEDDITLTQYTEENVAEASDLENEDDFNLPEGVNLNLYTETDTVDMIDDSAENKPEDWWEGNPIENTRMNNEPDVDINLVDKMINSAKSEEPLIELEDSNQILNLDIVEDNVTITQNNDLVDNLDNDETFTQSNDSTENQDLIDTPIQNVNEINLDADSSDTEILLEYSSDLNDSNNEFDVNLNSVDDEMELTEMSNIELQDYSTDEIIEDSKLGDLNRTGARGFVDQFMLTREKYGAQILVAIAAVTELGGSISAFQIIPLLVYPFFLLLCVIINIILAKKST